ncbi:hypothetical protein GE21DRAFT_8874 [Neurospora crassa]|uniref:Uncharacterized protein n=1 Tax=Neurospora crassa (strain ATCC 24698 / 74-OR23-1A / CBS 708.71 / DSM 1257 / FGSC 987) TaxID=367110 RepID=V5IKN0_NEUCR|nr:hypothetical protein NCU12092 [Neurospora crassa OR74A]ESA42163.1 hypothetical protein NCU12092 [Neurospora crassa OR74A]KHE80559.1 hypothetical protein GE21DRAFT_8874 [Neurospora crassa]|eukprot:XP_011395045.1 hypothetical protein NCU12092 [Neurospora crassa OR74A]
MLQLKFITSYPFIGICSFSAVETSGQSIPYGLSDGSLSPLSALREYDSRSQPLTSSSSSFPPAVFPTTQNPPSSPFSPNSITSPHHSTNSSSVPFCHTHPIGLKLPHTTNQSNTACTTLV